MKLSRKLQKALIFVVTALTTTLLLISVVSLTFAQTKKVIAGLITSGTSCTPSSPSSPGAWLLPVPSNNPPVAKNDEYRVVEEQITKSVLENDTDPDCDRLTVIEVTPGRYGNTAINPDGTITYTVTTPTSDSFTYTVSDGRGGTAKATVTVTD